jgi:3-phenylpropionate/trans-cinnamate dioxygenase ferredoxin reductase subunit
MSTQSVVIVGGGLAAVRTAQELRRRGHTGSIQIRSAEPVPPYDRPPLSKKYLRGDLPEEKLALWAPEQYAAEQVELRLGHAAVGLDPSAREVTMDDGSIVHYDQLVLATGAAARQLPVLADTPAAGTLRTAADSRRLATSVRAGAPIAILGGGFIGLEVAATAQELGCPVTVIEAMPAPLVNAIGLEAAEWLRARHESRGIRFRCGTTVDAAAPRTDGSVDLRLADGSSVTAAAVLVGVGVVRDCGWLAEAGLDVDGGLLCDEAGRTNLPGIFGAGDIVHRPGRGPIGHWTSAGDSARRTAQAMLDLDVPELADDGYFWSDQYDMRIQSAGRATHASTLNVVSGSLETGSFLAHIQTDQEFTGLLAVNKARDFIMAQHKMSEQLARATRGCRIPR